MLKNTSLDNNNNKINHQQPKVSNTIVCDISTNVSRSSVITTLSYSYPVKLICPNAQEHHSKCAAVYLLSYGGGLVGGDSVLLDIKVLNGSTLMLVCPSSTKVYKAKFDQQVTEQICRFFVDIGSLLMLMPEPLVPYKDSRFRQSIEVRMASLDSSALVLDWMQAGRLSLGESWQMNSFQSEITIQVDDSLVYRDVFELSSSVVSINQRFMGFNVYASLLLIGPRLNEMRHLVLQLQKKDQQTHGGIMPKSQAIIWSVSTINYRPDPRHDFGCVVRIAGTEVWQVRKFLNDHLLQGIDELTGTNYFTRLQ